MSNRLLRVNELLQRELSGYLRKRYTSEATRLTITGADVTGDLREAKVFYNVVGSDPDEVARMAAGSAPAPPSCAGSSAATSSCATCRP